MRVAIQTLLLGVASLSLAGPPATALAAEPDRARTFSVLVSNVSTERTLVLPDGTTSTVPVAPGAYAIVAEGVRLFEPNGRADPALERLAEDGDPDAFVQRLTRMPGVRSAGRFLHDEPFEVAVRPGERLAFLAMFAQSNDLFYAPEPDGIALFDAFGSARSGVLSGAIILWDAGTEVNEAPGVGPHQAPRQSMPGAGARENGTIRPVADGFRYPPSAEVLELAIEPSVQRAPARKRRLSWAARRGKGIR